MVYFVDLHLALMMFVDVGFQCPCLFDART